MARYGFKSKSRVLKSEAINCFNCNAEFDALIMDKRKFCSSSCAALFNNKLRPKKEKKPKVYRNHKRIRKYKKIGTCLFCNNEIIRNNGKKYGKYCNFGCQQNYQLSLKVESGNLSSRSAKLYLIKKFGAKCMDCGWDKKNVITGNVPIELEHIDGNSGNNSLENLKLLCPNCHSLTPTYKALNKGNGRHKRRERYLQGKSF